MARTAGSSLSLVVLAALAGLALLQPLGCKPAEDPLDEAQIRTVLEGVGPRVIVPALDEVEPLVDTLADATAALRDTLAAEEDAEAARTAARQAFANAMVGWQKIEVLQLGPAASADHPAGEGIRDEVYSWPTVNPCRVDQEIVAAEWDQADFFETRLVNAYGLDAIEYLLYADATNACPSQVDINADGTWDTLSEDEIDLRRATFAAALAVKATEHIDTLQTRWDPAGGDLGGQLASAGEEGSPWASPRDALDDVYQALFYLEEATKDGKVGLPAGILDECAATTCPEDTELLRSGLSREAIAANLDGFETLFRGGDGEGLDDLLIAVGHGDIDTAVTADLTEARAALAALETPLDQAVVDDAEGVQRLYDALKAIADDLKGDIATVLVLEIPEESAGDAD